MKQLFFCKLLLFYGYLSFGQVNLYGEIVEKGSNHPLQYATISIIDLTTNSLVTGGISDEKGWFNIDVPQGRYKILFEYISYEPAALIRDITETSLDLGTISLELNVETLEQVEIVAERTSVEIKLDKKIYNIGKDLTVRGGTVSDVLDNIPSVSVDVEGVVALRGNNDVRILINGKPSGLVGLNNSDALRQLPADAIERVEVITSPSGRYDAEGTAGILNIILRRSKLLGFNGAVTANAGYPKRLGLSGNVNYRTGDLNFFNTSSLINRFNPGNASTYTNFTNGAQQIEDREFEREQKNINTSIGLEWFLNEKTTFSTSLQYRNSAGSNNTLNLIQTINDNVDILSNSARNDDENTKDNTLQYGFDFDKSFGDSPDHKFSFSFQMEETGDFEKSQIKDSSRPNEQVTTDEAQERLFVQVDYVWPLSNKSQIEIGYQGRFLTLDTDYIVLQELEESSGEFVRNDGLSNTLIYREYVNAAYTQFGSKIERQFSYLLGLRMEHSEITIDQLTIGLDEVKRYYNFFPSVNLAYEFNEDKNITLGYNRRIRRPRSRLINPFPSRSSANNLFQGNPDLNPSYSNVIDLGYYENYGKVSVNGSIYYSHATDVFIFITEETGDFVIIGGTEVPVVRRTPINLATNDRYGFEFTLTLKPSNKWNINGNFNFFKSVTKGEYEETDFGADNLSWFIRLNNKYTLPGKVDWQTRMNYRGPREDAQNKTQGIFSINMAFSKDLFKDQASLTFTVNDLLNSRIRNTKTTTSNFIATREFQRRVRTVNLAFTYRFNQKKKKAGGRNPGGSTDDIPDF